MKSSFAKTKTRMVMAVVEGGRNQMQRLLSSAVVVLMCLLVLASYGEKVEGLRIEIHHKECLEEEVKNDNEMVSGSFIVYEHDGFWGRGGQGMDLTIWAPAGRVVHIVKAKLEDEFQFRAIRKGVYRFCFENPSSYPESIVFSVNVGHHLSVDPGIAKDEHMKPVIDAIDAVADILSEVESEREYLEARADRHYETLNSTQRRVLGYTILEAFAILATGVAQAYILTRLFEKKGYDRIVM